MVVRVVRFMTWVVSVQGLVEGELQVREENLKKL